MSKDKSTDTDLQGLVRLVTDATVGMTDLVEAMHQRIVHPPFIPSTPIQTLITDIAGLTYKNIRWTTQSIGQGLDKALGQLSPLLGDKRNSHDREAVRSALNGVVGDYLAKKKNPLAIKMSFRRSGQSIDLSNLQNEIPNINGRIILLVHGSSMNDLQWTRKKHNHGEQLAEELDMTLVNLHYNTGLHISTNGQALNEQLEELIQHWPVPVESLSIIGHSMGGLVSRSAVHYGQKEKKAWTNALTHLIFLGTPHHGAKLELAGNYLNVLLETIPYTKPFSRLAKIRSAGITDLRYGNLTDECRVSDDRFDINGDTRNHIPLPENINCYNVAAVTGDLSKIEADKLIGDRLVDLKSAIGEHSDSAKTLHFNSENTWIEYKSNHLDLLNNENIYSKLKSWLS